MQGEYDRENESIEEAYNEERQKLISDYSSEIDGMFDLRRVKEVQYKEAKQKREDQYQKEVEDLITKGRSRPPRYIPIFNLLCSFTYIHNL